MTLIIKLNKPPSFIG